MRIYTVPYSVYAAAPAQLVQIVPPSTKSIVIRRIACGNLNVALSTAQQCTIAAAVGTAFGGGSGGSSVIAKTDLDAAAAGPA